ncbi:hypothetical protein CEXT_102071 [Caerostris extrusa]|uniref:Uncharacterized protein n=1 Tax=Caerostris extrusa TaxID=172846 RepID=A0AAV4V238_CAEEX|nr:hypothetical protein CEXT_102071 [Caerostris extrusa]
MMCAKVVISAIRSRLNVQGFCGQSYCRLSGSSFLRSTGEKKKKLWGPTLAMEVTRTKGKKIMLMVSEDAFCILCDTTNLYVRRKQMPVVSWS